MQSTCEPVKMFAFVIKTPTNNLSSQDKSIIVFIKKRFYVLYVGIIFTT